MTAFLCHQTVPQINSSNMTVAVGFVRIFPQYGADGADGAPGANGADGADGTRLPICLADTPIPATTWRPDASAKPWATMVLTYSFMPPILQLACGR